MNKRVHKIGLIGIVVTLLVGCTNVNPGSSTLDETTSIEETNSSEQAESLEASYEMKTRDDIEITQDYVFQVDNQTPYQELITKTVDIHMFAQNFDIYGRDRGIDDVMEVIGVECLRKTRGGALYSVHKVEQGGLLYIFYNHDDEDTEIKTNEIRQWFYVRERMSAAAVQDLKGKGATIEDVIRIIGEEQIHLNCYRADPTFQGGEDGVLTTFHYFTDGILEIRYYWIYGEFICVPYFLHKDFNLEDRKADEYSPYDAFILGKDWVE